MAAIQLPSSVVRNIITALVDDATSDAIRVRAYLDVLGFGAVPENPPPWLARFLLHIAAALRLRSWELQGFCFHREAGLPDGRQAIRDAFRSLRNPDADPTELEIAVMRLSLQRFAWSGQRELGADIALDEPDEEALLEALADFMWAHRPR